VHPYKKPSGSPVSQKQAPLTSSHLKLISSLGAQRLPGGCTLPYALQFGKARLHPRPVSSTPLRLAKPWCLENNYKNLLFLVNPADCKT
ncbi:MAG: hypothetical protein V3U04_06595, partial [Candidatus Aerophobetes bacterium]